MCHRRDEGYVSRATRSDRNGAGVRRRVDAVGRVRVVEVGNEQRGEHKLVSWTGRV